MTGELTANSRQPAGSNWWLVAVFAVAVVVIAAVVLWPRKVDRAWERILTGGVITFATDASYPPFEMIDANGDYFGFDISLARAVAAQLGMRSQVEVRAQFDLVSYDGLLGTLAVHRTDVVISAFVADDTRLHEAFYTRPYFNAGTVLVTAAGIAVDGGPVSAEAAQTWAAGRTLAVAFGAQGDVIARQWSRRAVGVTLRALPDEVQAMQAVSDGVAAGALVDGPLAFDYLRQHPELQVSTPLEDLPYVLAVHPESSALLDALNRALAELEADGTLGELRAGGFGEAARELRWAGVSR